jgi:hypothetical protein
MQNVHNVLKPNRVDGTVRIATVVRHDFERPSARKTAQWLSHKSIKPDMA